MGTTGEYPFSHHRLSVLYNDAAGAQDRKLEALVKKAVGQLQAAGSGGGSGSSAAGGMGDDQQQQQQQVLLQQQLFEQDGAYDPLSASESASSTAAASTVGGILAARQLAAPVARSVTGSSDLVHVEAYHLVDVQERQVTINLKVGGGDGKEEEEAGRWRGRASRDEEQQECLTGLDALLEALCILVGLRWVRE